MHRKLLGIMNVDFNATDHIFCIHHILEKKWEYNEAVHQLFIGFKKAYDSVRREVLYNIFIQFCIPMKLVRPIKMCLIDTHSRVQVCMHLSDMFPIRNSLKQGNAVSPLFFNFALEYAIRRVQVNQDGLKLNGTPYPLVYAAADDDILGRSIHTIKKNMQKL
jgi:hypothetical protein